MGMGMERALLPVRAGRFATCGHWLPLQTHEANGTAAAVVSYG